jgi:predicted ATP-dependent serine protease
MSDIETEHGAADEPSNLHRCVECTAAYPRDVPQCPHCTAPNAELLSAAFTTQAEVDELTEQAHATDDSTAATPARRRNRGGAETVQLSAAEESE